jgi:hypothetical protein
MPFDGGPFHDRRNLAMAIEGAEDTPTDDGVYSVVTPVVGL